MSQLKKRTLAREYAFKFLYRLSLDEFKVEKEQLIESNNLRFALTNMLDDFEKSYLSEDKEHADNIVDSEIKSFAVKLIIGVISNFNELTSTISETISTHKIKTISNIDFPILSLGTYELLFEKTDKKIIINEAVNAAKKYGKENSGAFINGVLDKIGKRGK